MTACHLYATILLGKGMSRVRHGKCLWVPSPTPPMVRRLKSCHSCASPEHCAPNIQEKLLCHADYSPSTLLTGETTHTLSKVFHAIKSTTVLFPTTVKKLILLTRPVTFVTTTLPVSISYNTTSLNFSVAVRGFNSLEKKSPRVQSEQFTLGFSILVIITWVSALCWMYVNNNLFFSLQILTGYFFY